MHIGDIELDPGPSGKVGMMIIAAFWQQYATGH
jgi:hypothetical protein